MKPSESHTAWKARLQRRLAVVVDAGQTYAVRLAAVRAVQSMFDSGSQLRRQDAQDLLGRVLQPWATREELIGGRYAMVPVRRPPRGVRDVWA